MPFTKQKLRTALDRGEFVPYFQPIVHLRSGDIHGFEILARWQDPRQGLIQPFDFIPALERFGLMNALTTGLLTQAFSLVRSMPTNFGLSVNFSPSQLHDRSLPTLVRDMAEAADFDLRRLTIELTETALVDDLSLAGAVAADIKQLGIRLALDDFGTGYSSLLHLQAFPFDELKVDISFVRSMLASRQSRKITSAVVSLGISLGLQTVAEGVSDEAQALLLARQGCDLGQGYLYGSAMPPDQLADALARRHPGVCAPTDKPSSLLLEARPIEPLSQLRAIYDDAPVGLAFLDCDLRVINLNQRLANFGGFLVEAQIGKHVSKIVPEIYPQIEPFLHRALKGESIPGIEVHVPVEPGEPEQTMLATYAPVRDEMGEILGISVSVVDISTIKEKEKALRESEDHYRHMFELNPQIPWVLDAKGNAIAISSRWYTQTGLTQEEASNYGWLDALHPDDRERTRHEVTASVESGSSIDLQYRIRDEEKGWRWIRSRGAPRRNAAGEIISWYGAAECIDAEKRAIDALRCSELRLRAIFNAAPVGILLAEASTGKLLSANPRAEELFGFHFNPGIIWAAESSQAFDAEGQSIDPQELPLARAMNRVETTESEEIHLRRPDGSFVWLRLSAAPILFENGDLLGGVLVAQDIDRAKYESKRLLELAEELSQVVSRGDTAEGRQESAYLSHLA